MTGDHTVWLIDMQWPEERREKAFRDLVSALDAGQELVSTASVLNGIVYVTRKAEVPPPFKKPDA